VLSTLKYFRNEYIEHIVDKHCRAGVCNMEAAVADQKEVLA
jgi:succinate dehydrogenase/fumarate reductase-like Fe-S protein